jgi:hypothetical protein
MKKTDIITLQEEYPEFFEAFPLEVIEFALSERLSQKIANICIENRITNKEMVEGIAFRITYVIFEKLPKENFIITLKDGLDIAEERAKAITESVNTIIFSELERIKNRKEDVTREEPVAKKEVPQIKRDPSQKDVYRESVE